MKLSKNSKRRHYVGDLLVIDYTNERYCERFNWRDITPQEVCARLTKEDSTMYRAYLRHLTKEEEQEVWCELEQSIKSRKRGQKIGRALYHWLRPQFDEIDEIDEMWIDTYLTSDAALERFPKIKRLVKKNPAKLGPIALEASRESDYRIAIAFE